MHLRDLFVSGRRVYDFKVYALRFVLFGWGAIVVCFTFPIVAGRFKVNGLVAYFVRVCVLVFRGSLLFNRNPQ